MQEPRETVIAVSLDVEIVGRERLQYVRDRLPGHLGIGPVN